MMLTVTKDQLVALAIQAGFGRYDSTNCAGSSEFDDELCVGEYPCADSVLKLVQLLGVEVTE